MTHSPKHKTNQSKANPKLNKFLNKIICGDSLKILKTIPDESIDCVVTSPPYWALRDYDVKGQIGLESSIEEYLEKLLAIFDEVKRVLKPAGTCWVNFGDTYANKAEGSYQNNPRNNSSGSFAQRSVIPKLAVNINIPAKSLCMIPSRFAIQMIERGWILRNEIIWHKSNAMPQSARDRFTVDFEKVFFFVKEKKYYFKRQYEPLKNPNELKRKYSNPFGNHKYIKSLEKANKPLDLIKQSQEKILKLGRNKRCVWTMGNGISKANHFAVFPEKLIETPILAGCPENGIVLDPFMGIGTTAIVAKNLGRKFIGIELNRKYVKSGKKRLSLNR